jgi:hypothetical protein
MLSFIHVNRRVLDRSQLEVRGWLYCGVGELLEEEHHWLGELERFGPASEEGSAVLLAPACLQELHKRRYISGADDLVGARDRGRMILAPLAEVVPAGREFDFSVYCFVLTDKTTVYPVHPVHGSMIQ